MRAIGPVVDEACRQAELTLRDVDAIAVTEGPGLVGSLLVGLVYGKALALSLNKPLVGVNHLEGHIHAVLLENKMDRAAGKPVAEARLPAVTLVVSGGHTTLFYVTARASSVRPSMLISIMPSLDIRATTLPAKPSTRLRGCLLWDTPAGRSLISSPASEIPMRWILATSK